MRNRNTVGELGEKAFFPMYWNGDSRCVLSGQKLLPNSWRLHILTRSLRNPKSSSAVEKNYKLHDGQVITIGFERFLRT